MSLRSKSVSRRLAMTAGGAVFFSTRGAFADQLLAPTPRLTEGPFYPDRLPLDQDNDLIVIGESTTPAVGEVTHLTGRVLTPTGTALRNATVEIWQCDANAVYLHSRDSDAKKSQQDQHFQGYGQFETAGDGGYRFRTIKPVPYPGRPAPHIHIKVSQNGQELLTTQLLVRGHAGNARDGVFRRVREKQQRELLLGDFRKLDESKLTKAGIPEWSCHFDIILGQSPADAKEG
ncbi:MAG: intradiol ring-cleavage dioxygenase [Rhodopirellula sp. JB044]|uniref:dioxygenase family protein n=1 Tax=Rhodopirellula sp. JB044 TaxID=3342844 RepID=UPI00370C2B25